MLEPRKTSPCAHVPVTARERAHAILDEQAPSRAADTFDIHMLSNARVQASVFFVVASRLDRRAISCLTLSGLPRLPGLGPAIQLSADLLHSLEAPSGVFPVILFSFLARIQRTSPDHKQYGSYFRLALRLQCSHNSEATTDLCRKAIVRIPHA